MLVPAFTSGVILAPCAAERGSTFGHRTVICKKQGLLCSNLREFFFGFSDYLRSLWWLSTPVHAVNFEQGVTNLTMHMQTLLYMCRPV